MLNSTWTASRLSCLLFVIGSRTEHSHLVGSRAQVEDQAGELPSELLLTFHEGQTFVKLGHVPAGGMVSALLRY